MAFGGSIAHRLSAADGHARDGQRTSFKVYCIGCMQRECLPNLP